ncbi:basic amino acid ABC transporter substrate-binding protein [Mesorhizobium wenxiniae]|nr:basic amino acid ABC transporter substrate-binding protein [Mesorhizobium wenxiniae]
MGFRVHHLLGAAAIAMLASLNHNAVASAQDQKVLTFATDPTYPPFEFEKDGKLVGFDMDLIDAVGKAAGFEPKIESVPFDGIIPALKAGSYDGAIAAMVATEERAKSIAFSVPYFKTGAVILVKADDTTINGIDDLKGKRIAVELGSAFAELAAKVPDSTVSTFSGSNAPLIELQNGNVDAVIGDEIASDHAAKSGAAKGIKMLPGLISNDFYAIGFPQGSKNIELVNSGLKKVIESGEYSALYKKWFNREAPKF